MKNGTSSGGQAVKQTILATPRHKPGCQRMGPAFYERGERDVYDKDCPACQRLVSQARADAMLRREYERGRRHAEAGRSRALKPGYKPNTRRAAYTAGYDAPPRLRD